MIFKFRPLLLMWVIAAMLIVSQTFAQTGNIGINFSQVIDDQSAGANGEYEYDGDGWGFEIDGLLQSGDIYRGKLHGEVTFDISYVGIKLLTDTTLKGYTLDTMGRASNVFAALTIPIEAMNIDVGIGGKSAAPWGAPNALNTLVPLGYDEAALEALGLDKITPSPRGIPFQDGTSLQAYIATGFSKSDIDIDIKGILQLTGEEKAHQVLTSFDTSKPLFGNFTLDLGAEVIVMAYQEALHSEVAIFSGVGYKW